MKILYTGNNKNITGDLKDQLKTEETSGANHSTSEPNNSGNNSRFQIFSQTLQKFAENNPNIHCILVCSTLTWIFASCGIISCLYATCIPDSACYPISCYLVLSGFALVLTWIKPRDIKKQHELCLSFALLFLLILCEIILYELGRWLLGQVTHRIRLVTVDARDDTNKKSIQSIVSPVLVDNVYKQSAHQQCASPRSLKISIRALFIPLMKNSELLTQFGFLEHSTKDPKTEYLVNYHKNIKNEAIYYDMYFVNNHEKFSISKPFFPSFLLESSENEITTELLKKKLGSDIYKIESIEKIDTKIKNHLNLRPKEYLKVYCKTECGYNNVIGTLKTLSKQINLQKAVNIKNVNGKMRIAENKDDCDAFDIYSDFIGASKPHGTLESLVLGIHEYDIPFDIVFASENNIRCGKHYTTFFRDNTHILTECAGILPPEISVVAFDIETSKEPLKFPNAKHDQIMMISLVAEKEGILIVNKSYVKQNVYDFDYHIGNTEVKLNIRVLEYSNEELLLLAFIEQIYKIKPIVLTTYNGDSFDIPYIKERMQKYNIEYTLESLLHLDCYKWVKRDSYLPMGSQGLKAVTKIKLGYVPDEVNPEEMVYQAEHDSMKMASYSVSDSVATFELYKKYIHPFIYSLCTLIPLPPFDVLSKGSGTLCESLLIAESVNAKILIPPKRIESIYNYEGHICNEVSYVGGHVECLKSGIFRSDFDYTFNLKKNDIECVKSCFLTMPCNEEDKNAKQTILKEIDRLVDKFGENKEIRISCKPLIYHLDVGAMYPNIILTNRLQPISILNQNTCVNCDYFVSKTNLCQKSMKWKLRVDYMPAKKEEINMLKNALEKNNTKYLNLSENKQKEMLNEQVKKYSKQIYKKTSENKIVDMENVVCQRENSFYVDVVRAFRDKRYVLKKKHGELKLRLKSAPADEISAVTKEIIIYESLQVAHKCILNSFYGYVMRKNSRWYSMEMAAIVCNEGGKIIKEAKDFVDKIGTTLELDTDGIWCFIPSIFPVQIQKFNFLCFYLNETIKQKFTNHFYHTLNNNEYTINDVNEIAFEIDGPYKAMIIPSSIEENKMIKKRYVIIDKENRITEIKGFESKRRGELTIVKRFQEELFELFYQGETLNECYNIIKTHCLYYLNIIKTEGANMNEDDLFELFSESKNMSKKISEYEKSKSRTINSAKRLAEILGDNVLDESGLKCEFIQSRYPSKAEIAEKTIPVQVFKLPINEKNRFIKKWTGTEITDVKQIIDWKYYKERLSNIILRMIILPAIAQGIGNPISEIKVPSWAAEKTSYGDLTTFGVAKTVCKDVIYKKPHELPVYVKLEDSTNFTKFLKKVKDKWLELYNECSIISILDHKNDSILYTKNAKIVTKRLVLSNYLYFYAEYKQTCSVEGFENYITQIDKNVCKISEKYNDEIYKSYWAKNIVYDKFKNSIQYFLSKPKHNLNLSYSFSTLKMLKPHLITSFQYGSHDYFIHRKLDGTHNVITDNREHLNDSNFTVTKIGSYIAQCIYKSEVCGLLVSDKKFESLSEKLSKKSAIFLPVTYASHPSLGGSIKEVLNKHKTEIVEIDRRIKTMYYLAELFSMPLLSFFRFTHDEIFYALFFKHMPVHFDKLKKLDKTILADFTRYYHKTSRGFYSTFGLQIHVKNLVIACLQQNIGATDFGVLSESEKEVFNFLRGVAKDLRSITTINSKYGDYDRKYCKTLQDEFFNWLFYTNVYVSSNLANFLQSHIVSYYYNLIGKIQEFGAEVIMVNKFGMMINTKKQSYEACQLFYEILIGEINNDKQYQYLEIETLRVYEKITIVDPVNFYFITEDGNLRASNQSKKFVKNYLAEFFSGKIDNSYFYNLLIKRKYKNGDVIKNMLDIFETKQNIDELKSSCHKILNISEFCETHETEILMDITCKGCLHENIVIFTKLEISDCFFCSAPFDEKQIYEKIVKYFFNEISQRKKICMRCSRKNTRFLTDSCLCGSQFVISDLSKDIHYLIHYIKNQEHAANFKKFLTLYE